MGQENSVTVEEEDGVEIALTYGVWMKTCDFYKSHPSSTVTTKELAEMLRDLIELNKHDHDTIEYLNTRANRAMKKGQFTYD